MQVYYPKSNKDISSAVSALRDVPFAVRGNRLSGIPTQGVKPDKARHVIDLSKFDQILRFDGVKGEITVQAGCTLGQINDYLNDRGYVLPSCPQFFGVSAGSCAAIPVHGYSRNHQCIAAEMSRLKILLVETGDIFDVTAADKDWTNVFFGRMGRVIYLEVTFDCVPATTQFLSLRLENDDQLRPMLTLGGNDQQIITWYPAARKVSEIALRSQPLPEFSYRRVTKAFNIHRYPGYQWFLTQLLLKRSRHWMGPANLLMPGFRNINAIERLFAPAGKRVEVELAMGLEEALRLIDIVNALPASDRKFCVGFSWGGISAHIRHRLWDPAADIWIEMVGNEAKIRQVISRLKTGTYSFHSGKFVPVLKEADRPS